jgi:hypothetical protein
MTCGFALGSRPDNAGVTTIAATIVNELENAFGDRSGFSVRAPASNVLATLLARRVSRTAFPVGRGLSD